MLTRPHVYKLIPLIFWILAIATVPIWCIFDTHYGWDAKVYLNTIHSLQAGHDPYADGIAAQTVFHAQLALHPHDPAPLTYIYSPLTLLLLRAIGSFPPAVYIWGYWLIYATGALVLIWVSMQVIDPQVRRYFAFLAPAAVFFPGLLQKETIMSGNIAYILYGLVFVSAFLGWRRGRWLWLYLAVLVASCFKIPMLSLLTIPVLSAQKQWLRASITAAIGVSLFVMQYWIWPSYFRNFLHALELEFSYNHAFGVGPAGLFGNTLFNAGHAYSTPSVIFYVIFALPLFGFLFYLSRLFFDGKISLEQWIPVMLTGVILLNPRILEYDVSPLSLFMALIFWRVIASFTSTARAILLCSLSFIAINAAIICINGKDIDCYYWKHIDGLLLIGLFTAGSWNLLWQARQASYNYAALAEEEYSAGEEDSIHISHA